MEGKMMKRVAIPILSVLLVLGLASFVFATAPPGPTLAAAPANTVFNLVHQANMPACPGMTASLSEMIVENSGATAPMIDDIYAAENAAISVAPSTSLKAGPRAMAYAPSGTSMFAIMMTTPNAGTNGAAYTALLGTGGTVNAVARAGTIMALTTDTKAARASV